MKFLKNPKFIWGTAIVIVIFIAIASWQWDKWYALYTEMVVRVSREPKSKETKAIEKSAGYDGIPFESELTLDQHKKVNELSRGIKQAIILFVVKSLYSPDVENIAEEMLMAKRLPGGRDKHSYYQSRKGLKEEQDADSLSTAPIWKMLFNDGDSIAVVKILEFSSSLPQEFKSSLDIITQFGVREFIIDLRGNPGGIESGAVLLLKLFMDDNDILWTRRDKKEELVFNKKHLVKTLTISSIGEYKHLRQIVLLVNGHTASAAELFAGVMQEWGYAVIGEKTFGKGVAQDHFYLAAPQGSVLILTTAEYFIGKDKKKLDGVGVKPDILVRDIKDTPEDEQLEAAIKFLQNNPHRN